LTFSLYAQTDYSNKYKLGLTTGYTYAKSHFIQIGAIWGNYGYGNVHTPSKGFGIGADIGNFKNTFTVGAKAFYEYNLILISFRINAINYFSEQYSDFRLMPQFGISLLGNLNLMYGYSIPTLGNELTDIGRHSFSLTLNLFRPNKSANP
jgi:hypothetical protein